MDYKTLADEAAARLNKLEAEVERFRAKAALADWLAQQDWMGWDDEVAVLVLRQFSKRYDALTKENDPQPTKTRIARAMYVSFLRQMLSSGIARKDLPSYKDFRKRAKV